MVLGVQVSMDPALLSAKCTSAPEKWLSSANVLLPWNDTVHAPVTLEALPTLPNQQYVYPLPLISQVSEGGEAGCRPGRNCFGV